MGLAVDLTPTAVSGFPNHVPAPAGALPSSAPVAPKPVHTRSISAQHANSPPLFDHFPRIPRATRPIQSAKSLSSSFLLPPSAPTPPASSGSVSRAGKVMLSALGLWAVLKTLTIVIPDPSVDSIDQQDTVAPSPSRTDPRSSRLSAASPAAKSDALPRNRAALVAAEPQVTAAAPRSLKSPKGAATAGNRAHGASIAPFAQPDPPETLEATVNRLKVGI